MNRCKACQGQGYILVTKHARRRGLAIERCDACFRLLDDLYAAHAFVSDLAQGRKHARRIAAVLLDETDK